MKTVGKRIPAKGLESADALFQLVIELRAGKPFIPKGVHRFRTFEEAEQWSFKMKTRVSLAPRR